ncbi:MAG: alpha-amylase family glycosyl hydrolase [Victivallaceae bacterium]|nr:alpha-amylase family glycosyl hydrolase [Victivallaceae bacterium]
MNWEKITLLGVLGFGAATLFAAGIDNRDLMPKYRPDSEVVMEKSADGKRETPDWFKSLIMMEVRIDSATTDETLKKFTPVLDHLAEIGVNGIWLTPPINASTGYGNFGIHTLSSRLIGETDPVQQWKVLRNVVDEAHKRNIRVFFDVVTWGVTQNDNGAPIHKEKPEWFGEYYHPYRGWLFNWKNPELREWFASRLVEWFLMTGVDGFRCDCEPLYAGLDPFRIAKERMRSFGRKVVFLSEWISSRGGAFDLEQNSFCMKNAKGERYSRWYGDTYFLPGMNIVDDIRSGKHMRAWDDFDKEPGLERYYTYMLSCHDSFAYFVKGSPVRFGYAAIFAPFLPLWYIGEEWNNPPRFFDDSYRRYWIKKGEKLTPKTKFNINENVIDWKAKETNQTFFELVKKMVRIRRSNPDIFEYFPDNHRESNICKVSTDQSGVMQAYARFRNGRAFLIVPNTSAETKKFTVTIPFGEAGLDAKKAYRVTDALTDKVIAEGKFASFAVTLPADALGVFEVALQK